MEEEVGSMLSKAAKQILVGSGVLILIGVLSLANQFVELSPWVWAAFLAGAGLGAFGLYLTDRSAGLVLLAAYVLGAMAGLVALVPSNILHDEAVACYVLLAIALPFLVIFVRDRTRRWALIPAYPLLVIAGVVGLAASGLLSDDLICAYVAFAATIPCLAIYAWNRKKWWALLLGGVLVVLGLSLASWLSWDSVRASLVAGGAVEHSAAGAPLVIRNGTILDGTGAEPIPGGVVIVEGERIVAVGREADTAVPPDAQVIDARGGTILPGMIDSHVHSTWTPEIRREFLELGVTAVCDLGSPLERMHDFAQDTWNSRPVARGFRAGPIVTAPGGLPDAVLHADLNYEVGTPEEGRRGVVDLLGRGADVIKVYLQPTGNDQPYPVLTEAVLKAIVAEAHAHGVIVRAHVTRLSLVPMALDAGVDVIEHVPEPPLSEEIVVRSLVGSDDPLADLFDLYVVAEYDTLLPRVAKQEVIMVPTMARVVSARYGSQEEDWQRVLVDGMLEIIRRFHRAGGVIALGTDYSLGAEELRPDLFISEIQLLHAAGLTPTEVIEAATRHAAQVCGHGEDLGTLEVGKLADILVVDGDLSTDLGALEHVSLVIRGGVVAYGMPEEEQ